MLDHAYRGTSAAKIARPFLITTPEAWVPALGDAHHGFPYLSGAGRLVLKDTLMLAGAVMIMADSAREILKQRSNESSSTLLMGM